MSTFMTEKARLHGRLSAALAESPYPDTMALRYITRARRLHELRLALPCLDAMIIDSRERETLCGARGAKFRAELAGVRDLIVDLTT